MNAERASESPSEREAAGDLGEVGAGLQAQRAERAARRPRRRASRRAWASSGSTTRSPAASRRAAAGGPRGPGRRWRPARAARSARGTGRRTASRCRRRASGRRSSPRSWPSGDHRVADAAGVGARASSRRAAWPTRRVRAGPARARVWSSASSSIAGSHCAERPVIPWIRTIERAVAAQCGSGPGGRGAGSPRARANRPAVHEGCRSCRHRSVYPYPLRCYITRCNISARISDQER